MRVKPCMGFSPIAAIISGDIFSLLTIVHSGRTGILKNVQSLTGVNATVLKM